jgi:hypothetical protein
MGGGPATKAVGEVLLQRCSSLRVSADHRQETYQKMQQVTEYNAVDAVQCRVVSKCICAQHSPANRQQMAGAMVAKFGPATKG